MRLEFDRDFLIKEMGMKLPKVMKDVIDYTQNAFRREIVKDAAAITEELLKSTSSLPTRNGLYQFYDTQTDAAKMSIGWRIPKNTGDPHLLQMWKVNYSVGDDGDCSILVSNDKLVRGKTSDYYLFELLWNGTKPYIVAAELSNKRKKTVIKGKPYKSGKRAGQMRPDKIIVKPSQQEVFKKKHGKPAFKEWEAKMREQMALQNKILGKRNWHISAVEQDRRRRANQRKGEAVAVDREKAQRAKLALEHAGEYTNMNAHYSSDRESSGTTVERLGVTSSIYDNYEKLFKTLIHEKGGLIKEYAPQKMHFYSRYKGRFYYNQIYRKGIEGKVVQDFHEYVATCVYRGLMMAMGNVRKGNESMIVQQLSKAVFQHDIVYSH